VATVKTKAPARKLTQGERTAMTRALVLEAAIGVLVEHGFAGATTVRIQERAGVSRGRMLHHFPERENLLVAAVQHLAIARFEGLRGTVIDLRGEARIRAAIDGLWDTYNGPLFWAAMELWMGARNDESLRKALLPEERRLGAVVRDMADDLFGEDLTTKDGYADLREVLIASMRGVALTYSFDQRPMATDPHREMWHLLASKILLG
jgi:AcrR family transcriptional regulator